MTEIGDRIRERRLAQHLTQSDLAERLGYKSKTTIAKIEAGVNDIPQSKVVSFANALDTTPAYLMGWTDDPYEEEYDYENDPQHRLDEYCGAQWDALVEANNGDLAAAKEAFDHLRDEGHYLESNAASEKMYDLQDVYLNFAKEAQADGIDPEDIRAVIDILKKNRKK